MWYERALLPVVVVSLIGGTFGWFLQVQDGYGFLVYLALVLVAALAVYTFFAKRADGALSMHLYLAALAAKLAVSAARFWMVFDLYGGKGDSARYDGAGNRIAEVLSLGDYSILEEWRVGTRAMEFMTSFFYAILPESLEGLFVVFSFFAFLGSLFFLLAFRTAFPEKDPATYAAVVLFLPSILFWPASLGKDAVTLLGFGVIAYGVTLQWVRHAPHGFLWVVAGVAPILMVRPHSAGIFVFAAGIAALWSVFGTTRGMVARFAGILLLVIGGYYVLQVNAEFLFGKEIDENTTTRAVALYKHRREKYQVRESAVENPAAELALAPLQVVTTVLFRPFPWEVRSPGMAMTSLENLFFLWFFIIHRKALWENLKLTRKNMLLALCVFITLGIMAFQSGTANLGLVSRQRVQFLPYLFMLFM